MEKREHLSLSRRTTNKFRRNIGILKFLFGSSHCGTVEMNLTSNHEVSGSIPGLAQRVKDLALLWPAAIAPIQPLAWEPPYAVGAALKKWGKKKKAH